MGVACGRYALINHTLNNRTRQIWIALAAVFALAGVVNLVLALSEAALWPGVLAITVLLAAAGCVREAVTR